MRGVGWGTAVIATAIVLVFSGCVTLEAPDPAGTRAVDPDAWPGAAPIPVDGYHVGAVSLDGPVTLTTALPMLPLRVNEKGEFEGVPTRLPAYAYCDRGSNQGLRSTYAGDEVLRFFVQHDKMDRFAPWFAAKQGQPARPADFAPGSGAMVSWRNPQGLQGNTLLTFWVLRLDHAESLSSQLDPGVVKGMAAGDFVAFSATSPYSCCPLTWHLDPLSANRGHRDHLWEFCQVEVAFDPYHVVPAELPSHRTVPLG